jgi:copper chaperone
MLKFKVEAMSCGHCVRTIEAALAKLAPAGAIRTDLARQEVSIAGDLDPTLAIAAMKAAGYEAVIL